MTSYPPPTGDVLTPSQRDAVGRIMTAVDGAGYNKEMIQPQLQDLVKIMATACTSDDEQDRMIKELDRMVRWQRLPGYWLSYIFQLAMHQCNSISYIPACRLYSDAQISLNQDISLISLEIAYAGLEKWLAANDTKPARSVADDFKNRMRMIYSYYRQWYKPETSHKINPLTDHLYSWKTFEDLAAAFPELSNRPSVSLTPRDFQKIIDQCTRPEDIYCRVLARRFLGSIYEGRMDNNAAMEQYRLGLEEAQAVSLEAEIGHLLRLYGSALNKIGRHAEAVRQLEKALAHDNHPYFVYWKALTYRELGDAHLRMAPGNFDLTRPPEALTSALENYKAGRQYLETNIGQDVIPVARAIKQQSFRSFTENALQVAMLLKSKEDTLAELEADGPRYVTEVMAEGLAIGRKPAKARKALLRSRGVFHEHLAAFSESRSLDNDFSRYLASVRDRGIDRRLYLETRIHLTRELTHAQLSDEIAGKILALRIPNVIFLFFHLGRRQTKGILLDGRSGEMYDGIVEYGEQHWRRQHEVYKKAVDEAKASRTPDTSMRQALDNLLDFYNRSLEPFLEPFLPLLKNRQLIIFPRLFMNEVPLHAMTIGGVRLCEHCQVSYAQTLGQFLQVHRQGAILPPSQMTMVFDDQGAQLYEGTVKLLSLTCPGELCVQRGPSWQEFASAFDQSCPQELLFACHGVYDPDDPAASYLKFSDRLSVPFSQIFSDMSLDGCECVAMGACESGLGRTRVTAEYLGLPVAFFATGVRYVIGSLWQVKALASAILMGYYYKLLYDGRHSVAGALNEAQKIVAGMSREDVMAWIYKYLPDLAKASEPTIHKMDDRPFAHPYYWAGFYMAGDI